MKRRNKILIVILGSIAIFLLLVSALVLFVPAFINSDFVKREIVTHLSRRVGGQVEFSNTDFSFLPRPHVVIREAGLFIAGKVTVNIKSLTVYPKVWPLLSGRIEIARLSVESPDVKIDLPPSNGQTHTPTVAIDLKALRKNLSDFLAPMMPEIEGIYFRVENGKVTLLKGKDPGLWFKDIQILISNVSNQLQIELDCKSRLWKTASLKTRLNLMTFITDGQIDLIGLKPQLFPDDLLPKGPFKVKDAEIDLNLDFKTDLAKRFEATIKGGAPSLSLLYQNEKVAFKDANINGSLNLEDGRTSILISDLNLNYPGIGLSGQFVLDTGTPRVSLSLEGRELDVPSIRDVAFKLGKNVPVVEEIFSIVKGGHIPLITLNSNGSSVADLGKPENILIKGRMLKGKISVPEIGMDLEDVNGEALISQGILEGNRLEARIGKTFGSKGSLRLGLEGDNALFRLDMLIKADLTEALPILNRLVRNKSLTRELKLIDDVKGNATARLVLGESTSSIKARVEASEFDLNARYRRIPYPLHLKGGHLSYGGGVIKAQKIGGRVGKSSFSQFSGLFDWRKESCMEIESGRAHILLDEIYPWVSSFDTAKKALKEIRGIKGSVTLNILDMKGPLSDPKRWRFNTECDIRDLLLDSSLLPGPVAVAEGSVAASSETLALKQAKLRILDARLDLSGMAKGYMRGINRIEANVNGHMGLDAIGFVSKLTRLPDVFKINSPVTISKGQLVWNKDAETAFKGDLLVAEGPDISLDLVKTPRILKVEKLHIKDSTSNAMFGFSIGEDVIGVSFSGNLDRASLDGLLPKNKFFTGWMKGDLWGRIVPGNTMESTFEGNLRGGNVSFPELKLPAKIDRFSLEASQQRIRLKSAIAARDTAHMTVDGTLSPSEGGPLLSLDISGDGVDLDRLIKAFHKGEKKLTFKGGRERLSLPFSGTARIKLNYLKYGRFTWKPFYCTISPKEGELTVDITRGSICGISTPGTVKISPMGIALNFAPASKKQPLDTTIACLSKEAIKIDGTFDFEGEIKGEGRGEKLIRSLHGPIHFVAENGNINRFGLLANVFSLLNITEIFSGGLPNLVQEGFAYDSITVKGILKDGNLHLEKALVDGSSMNLACSGDIDLLEKKLDLIIFAAPFKTVDRILRMMPIIGYILDDTLVSIAVKVTGDLEHPKVDYLPAAMVGSGILGIMQRTLEVPVKVVEPIIPK
ncbi:MAG: AsmA-like C-terminal domain-containing protein [Proteobacteria bacterium]|nr:AsmA-like C-terminal domain-containing protein [Pseudomonadota bacterium]